MPSLNFTKFVNKVEAGFKTCTIRAKRKVPIQVGDRLYLYTGMRQKDCRKLREAACNAADPIQIDSENRAVYLRDETLTADQIKMLAHNDGFQSCDDFFKFFEVKGGLFDGQLIEW